MATYLTSGLFINLTFCKYIIVRHRLNDFDWCCPNDFLAGGAFLAATATIFSTSKSKSCLKSLSTCNLNCSWLKCHIHIYRNCRWRRCWRSYNLNDFFYFCFLLDFGRLLLKISSSSFGISINLGTLRTMIGSSGATSIFDVSGINTKIKPAIPHESNTTFQANFTVSGELR